LNSSSSGGVLDREMLPGTGHVNEAHITILYFFNLETSATVFAIFLLLILEL
jgi:hypothetical protein